MGFDDTWLFNAASNSWSQVSTSPTPPARYAHAMAATPTGVLLFGGSGNSGLLNDTWLYGPAAPPPPSPPPTGMPSISPWALTLLTLSLLGAGGWWFLRRRRFA